jgi:hypothetical protein
MLCENFIPQFIERVTRARRQMQRAAFGGQGKRGHSADPLGSSRDQSRLSIQLKIQKHSPDLR